MASAIEASGSQLATMALKRVDIQTASEILPGYHWYRWCLLPKIRQALRMQTPSLLHIWLVKHWVQIGSNWKFTQIQKYLMPDPIETLKAAEQLVKRWLCCVALLPCRPSIV